MPDEVQTFRWGKQLQSDRDELDHLVEAAWSRGTQERLQLRKRLFDGIEVRTVGRQKAEPGADAFESGLHLRLLVHRQVVEDDDVARAERRHQDLLDIREEGGVVDRPVEDGGGREALDAQRSDDRVGVPMAARRVIPKAHAPGTAAVAAQQIRRDAGFIEKDVGARVVQPLGVLPPAARRGDVRPALLVGVYRFF